MNNYIKNIPLSEFILKYQELQNLSKTALFFKVSTESVRKLFIKHNINYTKRQKFKCEHEFFSKDTPESWYWAGFLASDGHIQKNRIKLELSTKDKGHILKFQQAINLNAPIIDTVKIDNRPNFKSKIYYSSKIRFNSHQMVTDLFNKFNITNNKSKNYKIPDILFKNPLIQHFIRGMIDGDGWIYNTHIGMCGSLEATYKIYDFLKETLNLETGKIYQRTNGLCIFSFWKRLDKIKIVNFLYDQSCVHLERKYLTSREILISKSKKIEVNKDQLYQLRHLQKKEIAKLLGISNCTVARRMNEWNIPHQSQIIKK